MNKTELSKRLSATGKWVVDKTKSSTDVSFFRSYGGKAVRLILEYHGKGLWHVKFPSYLFTSAVSHFRSVEPETRYCQNKNFLFSTVKLLQAAGVWDSIENKQFFEVNENNKKSKKSDLRKSLQELISRE